MIRTKIVLGFALSASLVSFAPVADAVPVAASRAAVTLSSTDGRVREELDSRASWFRRAPIRRAVALTAATWFAVRAFGLRRASRAVRRSIKRSRISGPRARRTLKSR